MCCLLLLLPGEFLKFRRCVFNWVFAGSADVAAVLGSRRGADSVPGKHRVQQCEVRLQLAELVQSRGFRVPYHCCACAECDQVRHSNWYQYCAARRRPLLRRLLTRCATLTPLARCDYKCQIVSSIPFVSLLQPLEL